MERNRHTFLSFSTNPKNQNFAKMKKNSGDIIILHMCTKNYDQMMYGSLDMVRERQTDRQTDRQRDRQRDRRTDRRTDGRMDRRIDEQTDRKSDIYRWVPHLKKY